MLLEAQGCCLSHVAAVGTEDVPWAIGGIHFRETAKMQLQFVEIRNKSPMQTGREKLKGIAVVDTDQYLHSVYGRFCSSH